MPRRNAPIDVVCHREGYLEMRATFAVAPASTVEREEGLRREASGGQVAGGVGAAAELGGGVAGLGALSAGSVGAMATAASVMIGGQVLMLVGAIVDTVQNPPYAFRPLPEFLLVPATFESEAARDAFFMSVAAREEGAAEAQRAWIDAHCRPWPCKASDAEPCANPYCEGLRADVDDRLRDQLARTTGLRAQTRIVPP